MPEASNWEFHWQSWSGEWVVLVVVVGGGVGGSGGVWKGTYFLEFFKKLELLSAIALRNSHSSSVLSKPTACSITR